MFVPLLICIVSVEAARPTVLPVPPLFLLKVPVTPGFIAASPLKEAAEVLAKFTRILRAVASLVALPTLTSPKLFFPVPPLFTGKTPAEIPNSTFLSPVNSTPLGSDLP